VRIIPFALLAGLGWGLAAAASAAEADHGLAAARELGRVNGHALACGQKDIAAWAKTLMINQVPKTRAYGESYEEGTQETFIAHGRGQPCPTEAELKTALDAAERRLKAALSASEAMPTASERIPPGHRAGEPVPNGVAPRYLLQDPNGRAVTNEDFSGRFQLITFGYTSCPDVCPTTLLDMKDVLQRLGDNAARVQAIFITVDPERDSAQVLYEYTTAFDSRILGLRGSADLTRRAAAEFKIRYEKVSDPAAPPGSYTVDHSAGMILLGPDGRAVIRFAYATPAAHIAEQIQTLIAQSSARSLRQE